MKISAPRSAREERTQRPRSKRCKRKGWDEPAGTTRKSCRMGDETVKNTGRKRGQSEDRLRVIKPSLDA